MSKLFPVFSSPEFKFTSPRGKLNLLRQSVVDHDGPIPKEEVQLLFAEVCAICVVLVRETRVTDKWSMDADEVERLLRETIALLTPAPEPAAS